MRVHSGYGLRRRSELYDDPCSNHGHSLRCSARRSRDHERNVGGHSQGIAIRSEDSDFEKLESAAQESSNAWNNAGTGHAALCDLNYTPQKSDGSIDISKALEVKGELPSSRIWVKLRDLYCSRAERGLAKARLLFLSTVTGIRATKKEPRQLPTFTSHTH
jgi:hypothetical protein